MPRPNIFHQRFFNSAFTTFFMRGLVSPQPTLLQQTDYFCMRGLSQVSPQSTFLQWSVYRLFLNASLYT